MFKTNFGIPIIIEGYIVEKVFVEHKFSLVIYSKTTLILRLLHWS